MKKTKYGNKKITLYGIKFDSISESKFFLYLLNKYNREEIILQPKYILQDKFIDNIGKKIRPITYLADFQIGNYVIDIKGFETQVFKLKEKLFRFKYPTYKLFVGTCEQLIKII